jgi:hypothetical protein
MAKVPAIGQRSILADSSEDWLEVILKSGNFRTAGLPGATKYGWLGVFYKVMAAGWVLLFHE